MTIGLHAMTGFSSIMQRHLYHIGHQPVISISANTRTVQLHFLVDLHAYCIYSSLQGAIPNHNLLIWISTNTWIFAKLPQKI